jgi:TM2 domain-containing membrane protein YozV
MKSKVRCISLLGVFFINLCRAGIGSDTLLLIKKADSLFRAQQYYEAGNYYQKAYFYSQASENKITCILNKIACLKQQARFNEVDNIVGSIKVDNLNDSLLTELLGQGALCCYLANDFKKAESYLVKLEYNLANKSNLVQKNLLYSLVLNELQRWDEAKSKLKDYVTMVVKDNTVKNTYVLQIDSLYHKKNHPKLKKPETAQLLSHLFPGLGQLYAGAPLEGLSSLALNAFALSITGAAIYYKYYFSGLIAGDFLFGKLYFGGANRANFLAKKKNYQRINKYNNSIKKISLSYSK